MLVLWLMIQHGAGFYAHADVNEKILWQIYTKKKWMWSCADAVDNFLPMPGCCFSSGRLLWGCDPSIGNCRQVSEAGRRWRGLLSEEDQDQDSKQDDPLNWWLNVPFPCFIITTIVEWCRTQRFQRWQWNNKCFFCSFITAFYYAKCVITIYTIIQCTDSNWSGSIISINRKLQCTIVICTSQTNKSQANFKKNDFQPVSGFNSSLSETLHFGQHKKRKTSLFNVIFLDCASEKPFILLFSMNCLFVNVDTCN